MGLNLRERCVADCRHERNPNEIVVKCGAFKPPMTNADRIRAMSKEELAQRLLKYEGTEKRATPYGGHEHIFHGPHGETCGTKEYALQFWMEWLDEPAEVD